MDEQAIAEDKAKCLMMMHVSQGHSNPDELVAATQGARQKKFKLLVAQCPQQQQKSQGWRQDVPYRPQNQQGGQRTSMCLYHAKYSEYTPLL